MVIFYHIFEAFATSGLDQKFNHGYLAVDFFFVLSGFVIGFSYDEKMRSGGLSVRKFFARRLIRLHPMVIFGATLGAISFLVQGAKTWGGEAVSPLWIALAFLASMLLLPAFSPSLDVRGNTEIFPLNGPTWSLFFEYLGNVFYALFLRRLSRFKLALVVVLTFLALAANLFFINENGVYSLGVGWSRQTWNFLGGFLRMAFSFSLGLLLSRNFAPSRFSLGFLPASCLIIAIFATPYLGDEATILNGVFDLFCVAVIFPSIVYFSASNQTQNAKNQRVSNFLGELSYPLYVVHYPSMYLFYAWCWSSEPARNFEQTWLVAAVLVLANLVFAYLVWRFYDKPVRKFLTKKFS